MPKLTDDGEFDSPNDEEAFSSKRKNAELQLELERMRSRNRMMIALVGFLGAIFTAIIGTIPVGSPEQPLACQISDAPLINSIYNCNGVIEIVVASTFTPSVPTPNTIETSVAQTLTAIAPTQTPVSPTVRAVTATREPQFTKTPEIVMVTATLEPQPTTPVATTPSTSIPTSTPTFTATPTSTINSTAISNPTQTSRPTFTPLPPAQLVNIAANSSDGVMYQCDSPGTYWITYQDGAYLTPGYGWRTSILIFPDDIIRWDKNQQGESCNYGSQPCPQEYYYFVGHYGGSEFQTEQQILATEPQQASFSVYCDSYINLVAMSILGTYANNSGEVTVKIQKAQ